MTLSLDFAWLLAALLVSVRVAAAFVMTSVLGPATVPAPARLIVTLALAVTMIAALPIAPVALDAAGLFGAALAEAFVGASLAVGFLIAYAATQVAGRALDVQMGFGAAAVLNPATRTSGPLLGNVLGMLAIAVFLALDGHHVLIRALEASLRAYPPGSAGVTFDWGALLTHSGAMFTFGLVLAGPVMVTLLLADVGLAIASRSMPQLNVFVLSFSIKILLGLVGLAASVAAASASLTVLFEGTFRYWDEVTAGG